ncbi:MAG: HIT family protein [Desulfarculaceae bacterium]|jgi:histidine triad (HIT) family protein
MNQVQDPDCIFCQIVAGKIPCFKVYEDDWCLAFADINPIIQGHTLVISKNHRQNLFEMTPEDLAAVQRAAQKVGQAIIKAVGPCGMAILQLNGREANQIVMHYHVHLIPRNRESDGLNMLDWESTPGDMAAIEKTAAKIAAAL